VLPDVASTIVPPDLRSPFASASAMIAIAIRSFTEPPGLNASSLATTGARQSFATWRRRTSGVRPTVSRMLS
jgi:hypothetical protein